MQIAQIAPLTEAVPPKLYGGTERVVHWLTEELVALGHDVTLFASGELLHLGEARGGMAAGIAPRQFDPRSQCAAYDDAGAGPAARQRIRLPAFPSRLLSVLAVLAPVDAVCDDAARPPRPAGAPAAVRHILVDARGVDLQFAATAGAAGRWVRTDPSRPAGKAAHAAAGQAALLRVSRPHCARRRASIARSGSLSNAACR